MQIVLDGAAAFQPVLDALTLLLRVVSAKAEEIRAARSHAESDECEIQTSLERAFMRIAGGPFNPHTVGDLNDLEHVGIEPGPCAPRGRCWRSPSLGNRATTNLTRRAAGLF